MSLYEIKVQCSPFITHLIITWFRIQNGHVHVVAPIFYHLILQRSCRKMAITFYIAIIGK